MMKNFSKNQFLKSVALISAIFLFNPTLTFADTEANTEVKPTVPDKILQNDVVCPEDNDDVAMMGGMGGGMGGMGAMGTGGTQGTLGGMGGMSGMGGMMSGMGMMTVDSGSENETLAPNDAVSHSPCSKDNTNNNTQ